MRAHKHAQQLTLQAHTLTRMETYTKHTLCPALTLTLCELSEGGERGASTELRTRTRAPDIRLEKHSHIKMLTFERERILAHAHSHTHTYTA